MRDFFLRYRDRIIYGTDHIDNPETAPDEAARQVRRRWLRDWRYLATEYRTRFWELDAEVRGLGLPREAIDRVYRENALEAYPGAFS